MVVGGIRLLLSVVDVARRCGIQERGHWMTKNWQPSISPLLSFRLGSTELKTLCVHITQDGTP